MRLLKGPINVVRAFRFSWLSHRAREAFAEKNWSQAASFLEAAHRTGLSTNNTRYLLGSLYRKLGAFERSLLELDQIAGTLEEEACEAERHFTYATCLLRLRRFDECSEALSRVDEKSLSDENITRVAEMRHLIESAPANGDNQELQH